MFITLKYHYQIIEKYEKRIDELLNRIMSANFSEYKFVKDTKVAQDIEELPEPTSRTDEEEYEIEQARLKDITELEDKADDLKERMLKV